MLGITHEIITLPALPGSFRTKRALAFQTRRQDNGVGVWFKDFEPSARNDSSMVRRSNRYPSPPSPPEGSHTSFRFSRVLGLFCFAVSSIPAPNRRIKWSFRSWKRDLTTSNRVLCKTYLNQPLCYRPPHQHETTISGNDPCSFETNGGSNWLMKWGWNRNWCRDELLNEISVNPNVVRKSERHAFSLPALCAVLAVR